MYHAQKKGEFPERFWVKNPRHSEIIFAKKRYTSIVACVQALTRVSLITGTIPPSHRKEGRIGLFYHRRHPCLFLILQSCPDCLVVPPDELSGVLRILRNVPQRVRESVRERLVPRLLRQRSRDSACGFLRHPLDSCGDYQITRRQVKGLESNPKTVGIVRRGRYPIFSLVFWCSLSYSHD